MATINVILQAKARDKGVHKWLKTATSLADGLAASMDRAAKSMAGLGRGSLGAIAAGGGRGGRSGGGSARASGGGRDDATSFDKAIRSAQRTRERNSRQDSRDAERHVAAMARAGQQRVRGARRSAQALEQITDEQLREREIQREINARRTRAARNSAKASLGPDPTAAKMGPFGKLEFAENLAVAGAEFEQFGSRVEDGIRRNVDAFKDYEKAVVEVSTLTNNIPIDQIKSITTEAANQFGGLPTDQVKGFYAIVSAGATNAADAQAQLNAANKLAIGGVATQEEAVLAISKSVANFKSQGVDAAQAADSLFTAVQRGQTTVEEMARALPNVASAAAASGLSLDETNAALAVLSTRLPNAKEAATSLKAAFSNLQKPTKGAREEAKRLGIDFSVAGVEAAGGIEEFLLKLRAAEKFDENTLSKLFDSSEARAAISNLIDGMDDYRSVLSDMETKQGAADKAYSKMADTTAQKTAVMEAKLELLRIQAGETLVPVLINLADKIMPIVEGLRAWIEENPYVASSLGKMAIATAVAAKAAGGLISAYSMWQTISGITQLGNMKLGSSTEAVAGALTKQSSSMSIAAKSAGVFKGVMGAMPGILAVVSAAMLALNTVIDEASKTLDRYDEKIGKIEAEQQNISFMKEATDEQKQRLAYLQQELATAEDFSIEKKRIKDEIEKLTSEMAPRQKTERELLVERRNRLISTVEAARTARVESTGPNAGAQLRGGDIVGGYKAGAAGLFNQVTGVTDELARQQTQAELDLARFDAQYGGQLNLGDAAFTTEAPTSGFTGDTGTLAALAQLVDATRMVAENTKPNTGPSMEAGLS